MKIIDVACHDAAHLVVDLGLLSSILHRPPVESVDGDERKPVEELLVVDGVVTSLEEVILVRVIVLEEN